MMAVAAAPMSSSSSSNSSHHESHHHHHHHQQSPAQPTQSSSSGQQPAESTCTSPPSSSPSRKGASSFTSLVDLSPEMASSRANNHNHHHNNHHSNSHHNHHLHLSNSSNSSSLSLEGPCSLRDSPGSADSGSASAHCCAVSVHLSCNALGGPGGGKWSARISLCVGCGSEIYDQYILRVSPDLEWHAACLKCADCHQYLDESCTCFVREGKTYCKRDYLK